MHKFVAILMLATLGVAAGCQTRPGLVGNVSSSRQPIDGPLSIAEQSRAVQGGSFGNR